MAEEQAGRARENRVFPNSPVILTSQIWIQGNLCPSVNSTFHLKNNMENSQRENGDHEPTPMMKQCVFDLMEDKSFNKFATVNPITGGMLESGGGMLRIRFAIVRSWQCWVFAVLNRRNLDLIQIATVGSIDGVVYVPELECCNLDLIPSATVEIEDDSVSDVDPKCCNLDLVQIATVECTIIFV